MNAFLPSITKCEIARVYVQQMNPEVFQRAKNLLNLRPAKLRADSATSRDMKNSSSWGGHSALVRMRLALNGRTFRIAQMGPDFMFVEAPTNHPPGRAIIELQVDDSHRSWEVELPRGMTAGDERVELGVAA